VITFDRNTQSMVSGADEGLELWCAGMHLCRLPPFSCNSTHRRMPRGNSPRRRRSRRRCVPAVEPVGQPLKAWLNAFPECHTRLDRVVIPVLRPDLGGDRRIENHRERGRVRQEHIADLGSVEGYLLPEFWKDIVFGLSGIMSEAELHQIKVLLADGERVYDPYARNARTHSEAQNRLERAPARARRRCWTGNVYDPMAIGPDRASGLA
jgi:hypothetical protein